MWTEYIVGMIVVIGTILAIKYIYYPPAKTSTAVTAQAENFDWKQPFQNHTEITKRTTRELTTESTMRKTPRRKTTTTKRSSKRTPKRKTTTTTKRHTTSPAVKTKKCAIEGYEYSLDTDLCYKLHTQELHYGQALQACGQEMSQLLVVKDKKEAAVVADLMHRHSTTSVFTDLVLDPRLGSYVTGTGQHTPMGQLNFSNLDDLRSQCFFPGMNGVCSLAFDADQSSLFSSGSSAQRYICTNNIAF